MRQAYPSDMSDHAPVGDPARWTQRSAEFAGREVECFELGSGPGVVLVPEIPGATPAVFGLGEHLSAEGFTVVIPSIFGVPGRAPSGRAFLPVVARVCVSSEFRAFALNAQRPITRVLRAVATELAGRTPGRGVGVIGMCFTGGFALATAVDPSVSGAVASQPATPFPLSARHRADPGLSTGELDVVAERAARGAVCALGLRFSEDRASPPERLANLATRLGDAFEVIEIDSSEGNPGGFARDAHSVLTEEVRERAGHPAFEARRRVVEFLRERVG